MNEDGIMNCFPGGGGGGTARQVKLAFGPSFGKIYPDGDPGSDNTIYNCKIFPAPPTNLEEIGLNDRVDLCPTLEELRLLRKAGITMTVVNERYDNGKAEFYATGGDPSHVLSPAEQGVPYLLMTAYLTEVEVPEDDGTRHIYGNIVG